MKSLKNKNLWPEIFMKSDMARKLRRLRARRSGQPYDTNDMTAAEKAEMNKGGPGSGPRSGLEAGIKRRTELEEQKKKRSAERKERAARASKRRDEWIAEEAPGKERLAGYVSKLRPDADPEQYGVNTEPKGRRGVMKGGPGSGIKGHVATVAIIHQDKMLMGKRRDNGKYTNPGGHFDEGEDAREAAIRELHEEAGIKAKKEDLVPLGHDDVHTRAGPKRIHAFKYVITGDKPKTSSKNDPDKEVAKWQWVDMKWKEGDAKLPDYVKDNLHSPKNVLLDKMRIKYKSLLYIPDLSKAGAHKYIRKYMRGGKWIYVYHEGNTARNLSEEAVGHIKKLAELGDEHAKKLHESIEAHDENKLKLLRQLTDHGDKAAKKHLARLGIDREAEKLEEQTIPAQLQEKDSSEKDLEGPKHTAAVQAIKQAVDAAVFRHLASHTSSPYHQKLASNSITIESIMDKVKEKKTPKDMLAELHAQMSRIDAAHRGLAPSQNTSANQAGGYGSLAYNRAVEALETGNILPAGYSTVHKRSATQAPQHVPFKELEEKMARAKQEREDQERRALGEVAGSMAHSLNRFMTTPMEPRKILEVHEIFKRMFGKNMRAEDWPYDFSDKGYDVKITQISTTRTGVSFSFKVKDRDGNTVTDRWNRTWSYDSEGHPKIYNAYLAVNSSARGSDAPLGMLINKSQMKMMKDHAPDTGEIGVTAALDVGGYNWANQGFEFGSTSEARSQRERFKSFAERHGSALTDEELSHFKQPCHFAAFHNGKLYEVSLGSPIKVSSKQLEKGEIAPGVPLTAQERSSKQTSRMYVHLGKKFMLGNSFHGTIKARNMNDGNEAYRYMTRYSELKEKAWTQLNEGYKQAVKRVGGDAATPQVVANPSTSYSPRSSTAPPMGSTRARRSPQVRRPAAFVRWDRERQERWLTDNGPRMSRAQRNAARAAMARRTA